MPLTPPKTKTVLVLQTGLRPGPWACRSLRRAGFRVIAGHDVGRLAGRTRYAHAFRRYPSAVDEPGRFLEAVQQIVERDDVDALLPVDEGVLRRLAEEWHGRATLVGPEAEQYRMLCDKFELARLAATAGISYPPGVVVCSAAAAADGLPPLPNVVKLRRSEAPRASLGTAIVRTDEERATAIRAFVRATGEAFVQELVEGQGWRVLFASDGETVAGVTVLTRRKFPRASGMSSVSEVAQAPHLVEQTQRLITTVGYRGPGELEFIERKGTFFLHDVNLRLPAAVGVAIKAGLDMPRLGVEGALGGRVEPPIVRAARYVWLNGEAQALLAQLSSRTGSERAATIVRDIVLAAAMPRQTLDPFDLTDPLPTLAGLLALARAVGRQRRSA